MNFDNLTFDNLTPEDPIVQARVARLILAHLTADPLLAGSVFVEMNDDSAGYAVAYTNIILALTIGLAEAWRGDKDPSALIDFVRSQIAALEAEGE